MIAAQKPAYQPTETVWDHPPPEVREFHEDKREVWDQFIASAPNGHVMQAWSWGEYKRRLGFIAVRLAVVQNNQIVAAAQMVLRKSFGVAIAYVPRGPVCPPDDERSYRMLLEALHHHARRHRSFFLRLEPNERPKSAVGEVLRKNGFSVSPSHSYPNQPLVTLMVDLTGGPDAVMARMKKRTRNYVRSMSRRLHVRRAAGAADLKLFHQLVSDVAERRMMDTKPLSYYQSLLEELQPYQDAILLFVEIDGEVIAGQLVVAHGEEGIAMHNGRSSRHRNIPANQLLDWRSMEWCMERGCTRYDLFGIFENETFHQRSDTPESLTEDDIQPEMIGLYRYKAGFGSVPVTYIGPYDYPYYGLIYQLWKTTAQWHLTGAKRLQALRNRIEMLSRNSSMVRQ